MKRLLVALAAVGLLTGLLAGPVAAAPGGIARNQMTTIDYHITIGSGHDWTLVFNPCDGSVTGTGSEPAPYATSETITGTLADGVVTFTSTYSGPYLPGYWWTGSFPIGGGVLTASDSLGYTYTNVPIAVTDSQVTTWASHGDYVSSMGGGDDAAHSCIGMPIVAQQ